MARNIPKILQNGLVMWLDSAGKDLSGNGNNGTLVNSPTKVRRLQNDGLTYNGSNQALTVPHFNPGSSITIGFWFKNNSSADTLATLCAHYPGSGLDVTQAITIRRNSNDLQFVIGYLTESILTVSGGWTNYAVAGKYFFHTLTHDSSNNRKWYVNGVLVGSNTSSGLNLSHSTVWEFAKFGSSRYLTGDIINPMIWNRALSATEIQLLHKATFIK